MKTKRHILIFIDWFYPAYKAGGPVKSVFNLVQALKKDFDFYVVSSDRDLDGACLEVPINQWTSFKGVTVIYLSEEKQNKKTYLQLFEEIQPAVVYYNSLFSKKFTLLPYQSFKRLQVKQIIAPRGMLGEGSLAVKSFKKKAFLALAKRFFFKNEHTFWHATSQQEQKDIYKAIGENAKIKMAQNIASPIQSRDMNNIQKSEGALKLIFIARILPIKNLFFALRLLQELPEDKDILLDVYGPIEGGSYWQQCKVIIEKDPRITYKGVLSPVEIAPKLQEYHFYILPTLHENYGHSIVEALVAGVPVIISQQTPWRDLQEKGIGADLPVVAIADWLAYLKSALQMQQEAYEAMVGSCYEFAESNIVSGEHLKAARALFLLDN